MQETKGLLNRISQHHHLQILVNENCKVDIPEDILEKLQKPHKLYYYCFVYIDEGAETYKVDLKDITILGGEMVFGLPNQVFSNPYKSPHTLSYKVALTENTLALLPNAFPFLQDPLNSNSITFAADARERVKTIFSNLFKLLYGTAKPKDTEIILAHLNTLLTEFNSAYFTHSNTSNRTNHKLNKYIAFKLAVETNLMGQHDVHTIAEQLATTTNSLYGIVKEFSGVSPKEWITNRLMLEAQRKLRYSAPSVKELAYELGFNDPAYFSRLFKKSTGKSVSTFLADQRDLSSK